MMRRLAILGACLAVITLLGATFVAAQQQQDKADQPYWTDQQQPGATGTGQQQPGMQPRDQFRDEHPGMRGTVAQVPQHVLNEQQKRQGQIILMAPIHLDSPSALLGQADDLNLTQEQKSQLEAIQNDARRRAMAVLNEQQRRQIGDVQNVQPKSAYQLHRETRQRWMQHQQQPGMRGTGVDQPGLQPGQRDQQWQQQQPGQRDQQWQQQQPRGTAAGAEYFDPILVIMGEKYEPLPRGTGEPFDRPFQPGLRDDALEPGRRNSLEPGRGLQDEQNNDRNQNRNQNR